MFWMSLDLESKTRSDSFNSEFHSSATSDEDNPSFTKSNNKLIEHMFATRDN